MLILAFLYVIRIFAGSIASAVPISNWFLAFATFFFLSLAFSKRFCEILFLLKQSQDHAHGRDYLSADLQSLSSLGASSGYICVLIFALYISNPEINQLYSQPDFLWLVCPALIYWISRVWLLSHRGRMRQDPIVFALKDPVSYLVFGLCAVILFLAI